jgi:hypothetical protein
MHLAAIDRSLVSPDLQLPREFKQPAKWHSLNHRQNFGEFILVALKRLVACE